MCGARKEAHRACASERASMVGRGREALSATRLGKCPIQQHLVGLYRLRACAQNNTRRSSRRSCCSAVAAAGNACWVLALTPSRRSTPPPAPLRVRSVVCCVVLPRLRTHCVFACVRSQVLTTTRGQAVLRPTNIRRGAGMLHCAACAEVKALQEGGGGASDGSASRHTAVHPKYALPAVGSVIVFYQHAPLFICCVGGTNTRYGSNPASLCPPLSPRRKQ